MGSPSSRSQRATVLCHWQIRLGQAQEKLRSFSFPCCYRIFWPREKGEGLGGPEGCLPSIFSLLADENRVEPSTPFPHMATPLPGAGLNWLPLPRTVRERPCDLYWLRRPACEAGPGTSRAQPRAPQGKLRSSPVCFWRGVCQEEPLQLWPYPNFKAKLAPNEDSRGEGWKAPRCSWRTFRCSVPRAWSLLMVMWIKALRYLSNL